MQLKVNKKCTVSIRKTAFIWSRDFDQQFLISILVFYVIENEDQAIIF